MSNVISLVDAALARKLENFDEYARDAVYDLVEYLLDNRDQIIALARARHIWGHHEYGDSNLMEWDDARLKVERDQEVADWIVYRCEERRRAARSSSDPAA